MNLQSLLNSPRAGEAALNLCRLLPPGAGLRLADGIAAAVASRAQTPLVRILRLHQWMAGGRRASPPELDAAVLESLRWTGRAFYTFFHCFGSPARTRRMAPAPEKLLALYRQSQQEQRGLLIIGVHLGNFDLAIQAVALYGLRGLAISLPENGATGAAGQGAANPGAANPGAAVAWQHRLRRLSGIEVLPASVSTFRLGIERLQAGQVVATGIDHPLANGRDCPGFFGAPASLPNHYVHLAWKAQAPLVLVSALQDARGAIEIQVSDPIELQPFPDRERMIRENTQMILALAERWIGQNPQQWTVFKPVWPDLLDQVPT